MAVKVALAGTALALGVLLWLAARPGVAAAPVADGFQTPVGAPDGAGYYDAQPFGANRHLGEDWNGNGGGNTDLGDPVTAIGDGVVTVAEDFEGGWGNVVRIVHHLRGGDVESLYAHLDRIDVRVGQRVRRGQQVGTIGDAHHHYQAHLHLEVRARVGMDLGPGYAFDRSGYLDPSDFIAAHPPAGSASPRPPSSPR